MEKECCGNCLYFDGDMGGGGANAIRTITSSATSVRDMYIKTGTVCGGKGR